MKSLRPADFLVGHWVHTFEEDRDGEQSYRRQGAPVPLSRRPREVVAFYANGRFERLVPGPADAPAAIEGTWSTPVNADEVEVSFPNYGEREVWTIVHANDGELVLRKAQPHPPRR